MSTSTEKKRQKRPRLRRNPNLVTEEINNEPLPYLPIELVAQIFCRLPVKLLVQLRCMCKSWNSLISDRSFTRKHLSLSTTRRLHYAKYINKPCELIHNSYPLDSVLTNMSTKFKEPLVTLNSVYGCCDGILCIAVKRKGFVVLWNPSIRKFKESPPFETSCEIVNKVRDTYGFGYDRVSGNYKVVVLYYSEPNLPTVTTVKIHTLGTDFWKIIPNFPNGTHVFDEHSGTHLRGTLNWIAYTERRQQGPLFIASFDLGKESYRKLLPPDHEEISQLYLSLAVLRDCLGLISGHHIWVMKEYGIQDSWTKLFSVSFMQHPTKCYVLCKALHIF
ncbi:F-box/kelch-repeat protein At3g23880-like [Vicia villosa]|uniref:F-box/kelch-repeat protein At3g23880-like n=1 Tax=Vicia villosa TaxID=3911 RepID=UPI00273C9D0B|nr:F-box/kelch-repeat protein At3g23880-like [Vicia villosa]